MEICLPSATLWVISAATDIINLKIWFKESSILSLNIFLKMFLTYFIPFNAFYVMIYFIWCIRLGYNHPMPNLGVIQLPVSVSAMIGIWFVLPHDLLRRKDVRQKLRTYMTYFTWCIMLFCQNEILSYIFTNIPANFQFIVSFFIAACREADKRIRSYLVTKMIKKQNEDAVALLTVTISSFYSFFIAIRLSGATFTTVCCVVSIDFVHHLVLTWKLIKEYKKVDQEHDENRRKERAIGVTKLILVELVEGFTPMIYAICVAMAYYGPNVILFTNIGNHFWGKPIEDINHLFHTMLILFGVDTVSVVINSICLWKVMNISMIQEFYEVLIKYWFFMAIKLTFSVTNYFASNDINFGGDASGKFDWITSEGWANLICNSTDLTDNEKSLLLKNVDLI